MKPVPSPLSILDFAVTRFEFDLIGSKKPNEDPTQYFRSYDLDIDFGIDTDDIFKVFIKAEVNQSEEKLPGYSLIAEVACFFKFDADAGLSDSIKESIEGFSTVYIALNNLRGIISGFTANAPFGRYILPSIDLNDLITKKKKALNESNKREADENKTNRQRKGPAKKVKGT